MKYYGHTATGIDLISTSFRGLEQMAERRGTYLVDYYRSDAPPPSDINDAQAWSDFHATYGRASGRY